MEGGPAPEFVQDEQAGPWFRTGRVLRRQPQARKPRAGPSQGRPLRCRPVTRPPSQQDSWSGRDPRGSGLHGRSRRLCAAQLGGHCSHCGLPGGRPLTVAAVQSFGTRAWLPRVRARPSSRGSGPSPSPLPFSLAFPGRVSPRSCGAALCAGAARPPAAPLVTFGVCS